ncbi:hypothetical protein GCM10010912_11080 [Paenibacillus albidus]|uniref:Mannosyl-glycoprotein endo-beta-N-acetylglucosamidase-like domain-containing protein n=1 Tax=Paenibacillus albidus TaxID=2041023 RepID=A0A917FD51_9BACL|nr:glucosaminidase domain-containing protein [Paenibacillus albidus]GGF67869.1 hypothetical protein GCM10010912_11080 [Paenibacillus albidus]
MTEAEFMAAIAPYAVQDMRRTGIAASLTIAQAALESGFGNSELTVRAHNLFGMKGKGPAGSINMQTTEYVDGKAVKVTATFRAYHNWGESVKDHSALLLNGVSWNRNLYSRVVGAPGQTAAREIAAAGYATDPNYAAKLIQMMDRNNLYQYDKEAEEGDELSAEDKQKLTELEVELKALRALLDRLTVSKDTINLVADRVSALESRAGMAVPVWAQPAVQAAVEAGLLDTPGSGSYDFYRILTVLNRAGLLKAGKE